jgi:hypothetical protein
MKRFLSLAAILLLLLTGMFSCIGPVTTPPSTFTPVPSISAFIPDLSETEASVPALNSMPETPLSLARLPAVGCLDLGPSNETALNALGLGGALPTREPPYLPYQENGLYWSESLSLVEGDLLNITVYSCLPVSWFGVDWSKLDVRGVLALTDIDEDGWSFVPLYPDQASIKVNQEGTSLILTYIIQDTGEYQVVVKNASTLKSWRLYLTVMSAPNSAENVD